jgi:hypothetical protein
MRNAPTIGRLASSVASVTHGKKEAVPMDADRFDLLARALTCGTSRRALSRALTGLSLAGGVGALLGTDETSARKKNIKKKKKCKKSQKKCGKKCVPKDGCCPVCSSREICEFGFCFCAPGTIACGAFCCVSGAEVCYRADGDSRCLPLE